MESDKKSTRVMLAPKPLVSTNNSSEDPSLPPATFRPLALLLRVRVTQIVSGIVCVLLGTVACLEPLTRNSLSLGILVGSVAIVTATLSVHDVRLPTNVSLLARQPLARVVLTLFGVFSSLTLLGFSCLFLTSTNTTELGLAALEATSSLIILGCEGAVWLIGRSAFKPL